VRISANGEHGRFLSVYRAERAIEEVALEVLGLKVKGVEFEVPVRAAAS
jgi:hypothetical protein